MMKLEKNNKYTHYDLHSDDEQRANLEQLANYLYLLPADYEEFNMGVYMKTKRGYNIEPYEKVPACGSVACAIGHGPSAGITALDSDCTWWNYAERVFGFDDEEGSFVFGHDWTSIDNTPKGAALRIYYVLQHGLPDAYADIDLETMHEWIYAQL